MSVTVKSLALNEGGRRVMSFVDSDVVITGQENIRSVVKKKRIQPLDGQIIHVLGIVFHAD